MNSILTRAESDALRDACMSSVSSHAEDDMEGWGDIAYGFLIAYAEAAGDAFFTAEKVTAWSHDHPTFPVPHDDRAWGPVFLRAAREGVIERAGFGVNTRRHSSPCLLWRAKT